VIPGGSVGERIAVGGERPLSSLNLLFVFLCCKEAGDGEKITNKWGAGYKTPIPRLMRIFEEWKLGL